MRNISQGRNMKSRVTRTLDRPDDNASKKYALAIVKYQIIGHLSSQKLISLNAD